MTPSKGVEAAARLLGERARRDVPLGPMTTYRVGGRAAVLVEARSEEDLLLLRQVVTGSGVPVLVVGKGSNLLVADAGFPGVAVTLGGAFAAVEADVPAGRVGAGAAVALPVLARQTASLGLTGLEWAVGVPGSVGGAVRMNAGGHGSDISERLVRFRFVDLAGGEDGEFGPARLEYGYRRSTVAPHHVVTWAEFGLEPGDPEASAAKISDIVRWRREHQPGGQNAGSVFTNPPGDSAGRLVDAAGLKGLRVGSAHVSAKHANFIQADDGGSADDVLALIREVQRRVQEQTDVLLDVELRLVGFPEEALPARAAAARP